MSYFGNFFKDGSKKSGKTKKFFDDYGRSMVKGSWNADTGLGKVADAWGDLGKSDYKKVKKVTKAVGSKTKQTATKLKNKSKSKTTPPKDPKQPTTKTISAFKFNEPMEVDIMEVKMTKVRVTKPTTEKKQRKVVNENIIDMAEEPKRARQRG